MRVNLKDIQSSDWTEANIFKTCTLYRSKYHVYRILSQLTALNQAYTHIYILQNIKTYIL